MAQQAVAGIQVAGKDQGDPGIVEQRDTHDQRRDPAGAVQAADVHPRDFALSDGQVALVNLDRRAEIHGEEEKRAEEEQQAGNERRNPVRPSQPENAASAKAMSPKER